MERNEPTRSEDPNSGASSLVTSPPVGDCEGGTKKTERNYYEVFLSFRGKDTRKGFTDYLYTSLVEAGIHVFRDDNELCVGEEIGPELLRSITQSKISIPIISEDYASSKWCLRELALMLNCKRNKGQMVLPIFYKVEPWQVKHLIGRFGDAINTHKKNLEEKIVKEWEEALKEVTSLKGLESEKIDNGHEGTLVKIVVRKVMSKLKELFLLNVPKQLVGIDDHVDHIMRFIDAKISDTSIIGIYGMGGIGKTTLAKVLYNKLWSHYESHSFVADIREKFKLKGLECIQKQLISDISGGLCDVSNVDHGISILKSRCISKKVLILLDDVDDNTHLNALVEDGSWFKAGSMVIITTRDKSILDKVGVRHKYQLNGLLSKQSLVLFSRHAFRTDSPPSDYGVISRDIVCTTGGLPLALEVIGSFLCGKTKDAWKATSKKLKKVPNKKVQEKLRISYDALDFEDQQIFLDIACFFIGSSKQNLTYMWEACGFFPGKGIEVLNLMSLIKISGDGKLMMHDQLRDLGREIIRQENLKKPQKRSRLWEYEDGVDVLLSNKGTSKIEALRLDLDNGRESYTAETFKELTKLRLLQLEGVNLTGYFRNLFPQLRLLEWMDHQPDFELTNFHLKKLVVLDLSGSNTSENWGGWSQLKIATELKVLNLSSCALRTTPDLSAFKSLEILILEACYTLEEIHPSIEDIETLVSLNVNNCWKLKELPQGVGRMENLSKLLINGTNIREIPISRGCLTKLEILYASDCRRLARLPESWGSLMLLTQLDLKRTKIEELPKSIGSLKKLKTLNTSFCALLTYLPNSIGDLASLCCLDLSNCQKLAQLPDSIGSLVSLLQLLLSGCHSLRQIPGSIGKLTSLTELHLKSTAIKKLPESIGSLKELKILDASYCASLARIPNSIGNSTSLSRLDLTECHKLAQLPDSIGSLVSLLQLLLSGCHSLRQIPNSIGKLTSLTELHLKSTAIKELPESIGFLKELKTLDASYCKSLACIPNSIGNSTSLSRIDLTECHRLAQLPDSIGSLVSLPRLLLSGCHSLKQIPNSIEKLTSLIELHLKSTAIKELPESIGSLKELKILDASYCASLACIPNSIGNSTSLSRLDLTECHKLAQLPDSIGSLVSLPRLLLSGCHSLTQIPDSIGKLTSLTELHLKSTAIEELPESIGSLKELKILDASYCALLARIPNSIGNSTSLSRLDLTECHKLAQLPDSIGSLMSLPRLLLSGCHSLTQIPDSIGKLTSLIELHLKSTAIEELPESIGSLKELKILDASYCASLARIPNSIGNSTSLYHLDLTKCHKLAQFPDSIGSLVSLPRLLLSGCHSLRQIPSSIGKLTSLIELHLKSTAIEELPESIGSLKELKILDASYCASLARIPNSIGNSTSLFHLDLTECHKLVQLPNSIGSLMSLPRLLLSGCHSLRQIPDSIGKLTSLTKLHLKSTAIEELPESIGSLKKLKILDASYCTSLARIPNSIGNSTSLYYLDLTECHKLAQLPDSIGSLVSLLQLLLSGCHSLRQVPNSIVKLTSLTKLHLKSTAIEELPESIGSLKKLKILDASYCASLARISNSIGNSTSLSRLDLTECHKLAQLPDSIGSLVSLQQLSLSGCHSLKQMPDSIGKLTSLTELHLMSTAIAELPESIGSLKELKILDACYCASLARIPNSIGNSTSLSRLDLTECHKLAQLPNSIGSLVSLQRLLLSGCHSLKQMPDSIGKLTSLTELHLMSTAIAELPESIGSLKELKILDVSYCASLARIPNSIGNSTSLSRLDLTECHKLAQLPDSIGSLVSLPRLLLSGCHSLKQIPDSIGKLTSLTKLHLKSTAIEELPESIGSLKKLKILDASYCASLVCIPNSISNSKSLYHLDLTECHKLAQLPYSIGSLVSLLRLLLSGCHSLRQIPDSIGKLKSLTELHLKFTAIEELPKSIGSLKKLKILDASYCASLARIPNSIGDLASRCCLDLRNCRKLAQLPDSIGSLVSLPRLLLSGCHSLKQMPDSIGKLTLLTELHLKSTAIEELPESIGCLKELKILDASYCASLARIPNSIGNSTSLSRLDLTECHKLAQLPDSIGSLVSLLWLLLSGCHSLRQIPDSIGKLTSLIELHLKSTAIEELPKSIGNMQNLRILDISGTPIIELLDDPRILVELQEFRASGWKNLEGSPSNNSQLVSPNNLGLDKLQKLSELRSRVLALVLFKRPKTLATNNSAMDYQTVDSKHVLKRSRPFGILDEVNNLPANILPISYNCPSLSQSSYSSNYLPENVVITLSQGSLVKSMDFHPVQQILLLVGTNTGNVMIWEVGSGARIALIKFKVWDLGTCSMALQASLANDYIASINRVMWSPDGILFGVAYSKHMVHIYSHHGGDDIRNHLELEAHVGSVNDLAFSYPNKQLCVVTCGEDRLIKVWDAVTGAKQQTFEGHEAPVYSICPHNRENIQFIFSIATDGKIKAWFYDNSGSRVDWNAPGHSFTKIACSVDGKRLFSCGTNKEGESYLVEWNESEGAIKRTYHGLGKRSNGFVQFDTAKNGFLAAGDESMVKFWDMDNNNILTSIDANGGLSASPCIRFNKEGILLAVSTNDNSIKILANADGIRLLRTMDNWPFDASRITLGPLMKDNESMADVKPGIADDSGDKSRNWKPTKINEPSQCRSIRLPDNSTVTRVQRLIYTNSGRAILALSSNAAHKLWKSQESDQNLTGRATTSVVPQLWRPPCGTLMTNYTCRNPEDAVPCFAVSKNDSYLISASGGEIFLFNMETFEVITTFSPPPPDNDGIAVELEDSTIQIYSGQVDEIRTKLKGHHRIIKGFAFSTSLHVLVSSSADSQTMTTFVPPPPPTTFLAFYPQDNNIIAIGMEDSSIHIYNVRVDEFKANLKGHQKRITGLAFSNVLNVLVSSGADSQLCVWSTDGWEKQASKFLQMPTGQGAAPFADTRVQFHVDQIHLLVVHETQIATCKAPELECLKQWDTREASTPIADATYSCNGQSIYVSFEDGSISVLFASTLRLRCRINSAAYIPPNPNSRVYPLVIAAHPSQPNQFALGLTDGSVYVLEPLDSEGEWAGCPSVENGAEPSTTSGATSSDQPQR
ncbi:hypothetical protein ACJRO7_014346 [Eucalyptus globulus]|uniref:TIR domain-containing protein n=1 Tax=Eucalyptus globulus TaxID=34317 RepID=A0ABD3LAG7_EUCGL